MLQEGCAPIALQFMRRLRRDLQHQCCPKDRIPSSATTPHTSLNLQGVCTCWAPRDRLTLCSDLFHMPMQRLFRLFGSHEASDRFPLYFLSQAALFSRSPM